MTAPKTTPTETRPILWCNGCQREGCSCFHPPNAAGGHLPGCERGKYVPPPAATDVGKKAPR